MADITQICKKCGKKFLVIEIEQEFLKKKSLPLPTMCPSDRQLRRLVNRGERFLYRTKCQQCGAKMITSYDPAKVTSQILCKKCYREYYETHELVQPA